MQFYRNFYGNEMLNKITKDFLVSKQNEIRFIIRVYALIKCRGLINLHLNNNLVKKAPKNSYHLCVFENMVTGISEEEVYDSFLVEDLLKKGFLQKWVLADVDGAMKGNSLVKRRNR